VSKINCLLYKDILSTVQRLCSNHKNALIIWPSTTVADSTRTGRAPTLPTVQQATTLARLHTACCAYIYTGLDLCFINDVIPLKQLKSQLSFMS